MSRPIKETERNQDATVYIGNIDEEADEEIIYELMLQAGPVVAVHLPKDRVNQTHQGYGFCEFRSEKDADYASLIMNYIRLYGKPLRVNKASLDKQKNLDIGADLFVGNLDPMVDEKVLYNTFSTFGTLISQPKIARDEKMASKGYGFVSFDSFEASDRALEAMNNQYLMNKPCQVDYAFKKDGKGERHGDEAERLLAAQAKKNNYSITDASAKPSPAAPLQFSASPTPVPPPPPSGFQTKQTDSKSIPPPPPPIR
jgi:splicing factor 3B subunit 4